mgnify:CR=1 FL=1
MSCRFVLCLALNSAPPKTRVALTIHSNYSIIIIHYNTAHDRTLWCQRFRLCMPHQQMPPSTICHKTKTNKFRNITNAQACKKLKVIH